MMRLFLRVFCATAIGILLLLGWHQIVLLEVRKEYEEDFKTIDDVYIRKFPFPFKAAVAICSDIDMTGTMEEFVEIQRFLNTKEMTIMGQGVGLQIGNSFLMYEDPKHTISYFNSGSDVAAEIGKYIKSGAIDVMHSFGRKKEFSRDHAIQAIAELENNNLKVDVWVDHATASNNMGDDVTFGTGDHPDSDTYHADLTIRYGIKYAWLGRVTMIIGQEVVPDLEQFYQIFDSAHYVKSISNMVKELAKHYLSFLGSKKYSMHAKNRLVEIKQLDDGQKIYEFIRFDNHWDGVSTGANSKNLGYILSEKSIQRLKSRSGYMIVYTHLGMNDGCKDVICEEAVNSLRLLEKEFRDGEIFVTTTSKLLNYYIVSKYLNWVIDKKNNDLIRITILSVEDPVFGSFIPSMQQLEGITFCIPKNKKIEMYLGQEEIHSVKVNSNDQKNQASISIIK
jgi:hypothetical protein